MSLRPFSRVSRAQELPGHCLRCPRKEDLIDLGAEGIPGFGVAYLCTVCLSDLFDQMQVIPQATHEEAVAALRAQIDSVQEALDSAAVSANAPITYVTSLMEEFAHGVDQLSRNLVRNLATGPSRIDPLPRPAAAEAHDEPDADAGEAAGAASEDDGRDDGGDPRLAILQHLGIADESVADDGGDGGEAIAVDEAGAGDDDPWSVVLGG